MRTGRTYFLRGFLLAACIASAGPVIAGDEVFRWRDDAGVMHYADRTDVPDADVLRLEDYSPGLVPRQSSMSKRCADCVRPPRCDARRREPGCGRRK